MHIHFLFRSLSRLPAVAMFAAVTVAGLGAETSYPIEYTGTYDRTVTVESEPERVVSIAPSITEIMFAIDRDDRLVGRTSFCDYPPEALEVEEIGSLQEPNIEKIISLEPDLVIASTHFTRDAFELLEQAGVPVAIIDDGQEGQSFEDVYDSIRDVGLLTNAQENAERVVEDMQATVREVEETVAGASRPRVYYVIGFGEGGDYTAGGDTFVGRLIEMAGGDNIASDVEGWSYSLERVIAADPDIVISSKYHGIPEQLEDAHGYRDLDAIREGRLRPIDNDKIDRPGPRLADGLRELAEAIHPERF